MTKTSTLVGIIIAIILVGGIAYAFSAHSDAAMMKGEQPAAMKDQAGAALTGDAMMKADATGTMMKDDAAAMKTATGTMMKDDGAMMPGDSIQKTQ